MGLDLSGSSLFFVLYVLIFMSQLSMLSMICGTIGKARAF